MKKSQVTPGVYRYRLPDWATDTWVHVWVGSRPGMGLVVSFGVEGYPIALADIPHDAIFEVED